MKEREKWGGEGCEFFSSKYIHIELDLIFKVNTFNFLNFQMSKTKEDKKVLNVTCAIIQFEEKVLVVQRSEKMKLPLKWEFPGGKIESGETEEECIFREIKEELSIEIEVIGKLGASVFTYDGVTIRLIPFLAYYKTGKIKLMEHKQYKWFRREQLEELNWAEADIPILNEFLTI